LSETAHVGSEQIFSTFATLTETIVFVYMGMGVFTGRYKTFDWKFSVIALLACFVGRFLNVVPLSFLSNLCRRGRHVITGRHQAVLWFAGLRGAIAYALSENMPGPHKEVYMTGTLSICIFTTIVGGSCTARVLTIFGMKEDRFSYLIDSGPDLKLQSLSYRPPVVRPQESEVELKTRKIREGIKGLWYRFDDQILKPHFGGDAIEAVVQEKGGGGGQSQHSGHSHIEMGSLPRSGSDAGSDDNDSDDDDDTAQHRSLLR
jgi:hypothetical protein